MAEVVKAILVKQCGWPIDHHKLYEPLRFSDIAAYCGQEYHGKKACLIEKLHWKPMIVNMPILSSLSVFKELNFAALGFRSD